MARYGTSLPILYIYENKQTNENKLNVGQAVVSNTVNTRVWFKNLLAEIFHL